MADTDWTLNKIQLKVTQAGFIQTPLFAVKTSKNISGKRGQSVELQVMMLTHHGIKCMLLVIIIKSNIT